MPRKTDVKGPRRKKGEGSVFFHAGVGMWAAVANLGVDENGKRRRRQVYGKRQSDVLKKLRAIEFEVASGRAAEKPTRQSVAVFMQQWLDSPETAELRPTTRHNYRGVVDRHIVGDHGIGHLKVRDLEPETLTAFYARLAKAGVGDRSRQLTHAVLRRALGDALTAGIVARNVAKMVTAPKYGSPEMRPLSQDEARRFLEVARTDRLSALYVLAILTGMREGELFALTWGEVDLKNGTARILHTLQDVNGALKIAAVKTDKSKRLVHLPKLAITALDAHRKQSENEGFSTSDNDYVFVAPNGSPLRYQGLAMRSFKPLLERAGLPNIRFHNLRHTFATAMLTLGTHPKIVQEALGHAKISTTLDTYSHVVPTLAKEAARKLGAALTPPSTKRP